MIHEGLVFFIDRENTPPGEGRYIVDISPEGTTPNLVSGRWDGEQWNPKEVRGWLHGYRAGLLISDKAEGQDSFFQVEAWILQSK